MVTLTLMILLTVIAVGLLTISSISLRTSQQAQNQAEARANARFAMMMALAQLQLQAGPDQRATATAAVVKPTAKNSKWVGVWSSTERASTPTKDPIVNRPVVGAYENPAFLTDLRETASSLRGSRWKNELRLGWLVSGENSDPTPDFNATTDIKLVSNNSVATPADQVWAPKVKLPGGSYAYWVSDENAKANVAVNHPYAGKTADPANASNGGYYRLAGAEPPNPSTVNAGAKTPYAAVAGSDASDRSKLLSLPQVSLTATPEDLKNNFHDLTTSSKSVLSNNRTGGLKTDLTTVLEQQRGGANRGVTMTSNPLKLKQVLPETPIIDGNWHKYSGPRFDHLYAWYRLMDELAGSRVGDYSMSPRYLDARATTAERGINEGWTINHLAKTGSSYSQMPVTIQPQLVDFKLQFDFTLDTSRGNGRAIRAHVYPRLVLWNPYNVKLKGKRYVVMAPYYPWDYGSSFTVGGVSATKSVAGDPSSGQLFPGSTNGFAFTVEATDFEPGQCLVFTPKTSASGGALIGGNSAKYNGTDLSKNLLSATKPADRQNFYFPSGWSVAPEVDLNQPQIPYGLTGGVNGCIATGQQVFLLKRAPDTGNIAPTSLYQDRNYATVSRHVCHYQGQGDYYWWYVPGMSNNGANDAPFGFVRHENYPERNPPRLWFTEARQRWFDESMEQSSIGQQWGKGSAVWYNVPLIAAFNVRAPLVHRSQFCYYNDWTRYSPGGFMIPWASERTFGTPKEAPFVGGKALGSPWGLAGDWAAVGGRYPMFDVPSPEVGVFSLADFQHAEIGFETWQPSYIIGTALSEARSDRDATAKRDYVAVHPGAGGNSPSGTAGSPPWNTEFHKAWSGVWKDLVQATDQPNEVQCYDIAYETNHYLWDDYFLSTIPFKRGSATPQITWDVTNPLPNSRLVLNPWTGLSTTDLQKNLSSPPTGAGYASNSAYPSHHAAWFLMDDGGFNVNSASVEAWRAILSTTRDLKRPTQSGADASGNVFSRLLMPLSNANQNGGLKSSGAWNGVRTLTDSEIKTLAEAIVREVKLRGPFLSLSDFVNRRLTAASTRGVQTADDTSVRGTLQSAIERANLNRTYQATGNSLLATDRTGGTINNGSGGFVTDYEAMPDWKAFGAPTYLTQADILQQLGPHLTVRGDTYIIRTYGEKLDPQGNVLAKAWCEVVVQRTPDYVDGRDPSDYSTSGPGNHPVEPLNITNGNTLVSNPRITSINQRMGRHFTITSFRWLHSNEI